MLMAKRHLSLKDLASELNISISTVSRALKNHPDISPDLTRKVQELAMVRNYTPNPLAMGLLRQETRMIGVIVPDLVTHFYSSIISGIEEYAKSKGYFILLSSSYESMEKEIESVSNLLKARVDGMIVCLSKETNKFDHFLHLIQNEIPLVFFDRVCLSETVPCVIIDNQDAIEQIIFHLHEQKYKRIAFISGPAHLNISREREIGYLSGLKKLGRKYDPSLLCSSNMLISEAVQIITGLLALPDPPDAIFGINDMMIYAVMKELKARGIGIPEEFGVVGFADEFHASFVSPQLTSIMHPTHEIGIKAAELFFKKKDDPGFAETVVLQTQLVVRKSSART
ncbi:MAG: LacI family DNA-binding transcriptional regulator [Prolixibacteraceae bacterium]